MDIIKFLSDPIWGGIGILFVILSLFRKAIWAFDLNDLMSKYKWIGIHFILSSVIIVYITYVLTNHFEKTEVVDYLQIYAIFSMPTFIFSISIPSKNVEYNNFRGMLYYIYVFGNIFIALAFFATCKHINFEQCIILTALILTIPFSWYALDKSGLVSK